jgi:hypothetical protein
MSSALLWQFEGLFKVLEKIGNVTYKLELSYYMRAHHIVFHINWLKPCRIDEGNPSRVASSRALVLIADKSQLEVDKMFAHGIAHFCKNRRHEHFVN